MSLVGENSKFPHTCCGFTAGRINQKPAGENWNTDTEGTMGCREAGTGLRTLVGSFFTLDGGRRGVTNPTPSHSSPCLHKVLGNPQPSTSHTQV